MRNLESRFCIAFPTLLIGATVTLGSQCWAAESWPQWRGSDQNGVAVGDRFPSKWSSDSGVAWKTGVPGKGGSTPVVSGNSAFITAGVDGKNTLLAFNVEDGSLKWQREVGEDRGNKHKKGSGSNPSAVVEGDLVFAYFRSGDLACIDEQGNVQWQINLQELFGEDTLWWDLGSSPTLTSNAIVVAVMQSGPSYLVAFDKRTGEQLWKTDRMLGAPQEAAQSYSTPVVVSVNGDEALAVMGADHLTLHRASDGLELGRLGGFNPNDEQYFRSIASPVADGDILVCPYARGATLTAVRMNDLADGKGKESIAWFRDDLGSDVPTPAAHEGRIYVVSDSKQSKGLISCLDKDSGKTIWSLQLPKLRIGFSSSPLIASNQLYVTSENGTTYVIGPLTAEQPQVISENAIDDDAQFTVASPIPLGETILLRSRSNLYRIAGE